MSDAAAETRPAVLALKRLLDAPLKARFWMCRPERAGRPASRPRGLPPPQVRGCAQALDTTAHARRYRVCAMHLEAERVVVGARHTVGLPDEDGATTQARLVARFRARTGLALHRGLIQAYQMRAQMVQRIWEERTGMSAVTDLELRFQ
jgi:hypothetical protein